MRRVCVVCVCLSAAGCADIDRLAPGECGNGVVEAGEDCDVYPAHAGAGLSCGTEREQACRYVCDPSSAEPACPAGWACGNDGLCAHPTGAFERAAGAQLSLDVDDWAVHDVDGDGAPDVTGHRENAVLVRFGGGGGAFSGAFELVTPEVVGRVTFGDLDGDGGADAIVPLEPGLYVLRGSAHSLEPAAAMLDDLARFPPDVQFFSIRVDSVYFEFDDVLAVYDTKAELIVEVVYTQPGTGRSYVTLPEYHPIAELTTPVARANIDSDPADIPHEFALAFNGDDVVRIYGQVGSPLPVRVGLRAEVPLSGMTVDKGAKFADVDGDGHLDLLVSVDDDRVAVALGDGQGDFGAATVDPRFDDLLAVTDPLGVLQELYTEFQRWPLAAADLDGDGVADYVSGNGVYLTDAGAGRLRQVEWRFHQRSTWQRAVVADFNGDRVADVAAIAGKDAQQDGIELFLGVGGTSAQQFVPTGGAPHLIEVGDYDGNLVADIAVVETDPLGGPESLSILYGSQSEGLGAPISMGTVYYPFMTTSGRLREFDLVPGAMDDIHVRSTRGPGGTGDIVFGIVRGSPVRRMVCPYYPRDAEAAPFGDRAREIAIGRFWSGHDERDVVIVGKGLDLPGLTDPDPRLWLIPGAPGAELSTGAYYPEPVVGKLGDDTCDAEGALLAAVDFERDGVDEFAMFDQSDGCESHGTGGSPPSRLIAGRVTGEPRFELTELGAVAGGFRVPYQLEVADLDADGADDLVVTFAGEYLVSDGGLAEGAGVVVLWNTGVGLDTGQTSIALVPAGVEHVVSAVPIDADEDADRELAVLTDAGLFVCELAGRKFSEPCRQVEGVAGLRRTKGGGERLRIADVDGDGLDDALVGRRGQIDVYRSVRHFDADGGELP